VDLFVKRKKNPQWEYHAPSSCANYNKTDLTMKSTVHHIKHIVKDHGNTHNHNSNHHLHEMTLSFVIYKQVMTYSAFACVRAFRSYFRDKQ